MQKKLVVEFTNQGRKVEVSGSPVDIMCMANEALVGCMKALEKHPQISHEDAVKLMDEVVKSYQTEAEHGPEAAAFRAFMEFLKLC